MVKGKMRIAMLVVIMMACTAFPVFAQTADVVQVTKSGSIQHDSSGYRGCVSVTGYNSEGEPLDMVAGVNMKGEWRVNFGKPTAKVCSEYSKTRVPCYFAYGIGNELDFTTVWMQN